MTKNRSSDHPNEDQEDPKKNLLPKKKEIESEGNISRLKKFFSGLVRRNVEEPKPKTAKEIRAEELQKKVDEKLSTFPKTVKLNHPELREATDMRTERYYGFAKKLLKICPHDPKIWGLFFDYISKYPNGSYLLDLIEDAGGKNVQFLKIFLKVAVHAGSEHCSILIGLQKALYGDDIEKLVSAGQALTGLSNEKHFKYILANKDLFKDSIEKFSLFIEYLEHHETFDGKTAKDFIDQRFGRNQPYR